MYSTGLCILLCTYSTCMYFMTITVVSLVRKEKKGPHKYDIYDICFVYSLKGWLMCGLFKIIFYSRLQLKKLFITVYLPLFSILFHPLIKFPSKKHKSEINK